MGTSLGLRLYALSRRPSQLPPPGWPERPAGRLVWLHAPGPGSSRALAELARRIHADTGHPVLLTCPVPLPGLRGVLQCPPPEDAPAAARAFLDHWRPELCLMAEGELRPALIHEAAARRIALVMVDARQPTVAGNPRGWYPGLVSASLQRFDTIIAVDDAAARIFRRAGAPADAVRVEGRMEEGSGALPCNEAERAALVRQFQTRPVWLAAALPEAEEAAVIAAHRAALRLAHRLLLIIVPEHPARSDALAAQIAEAEGWTVARRGSDEEPDEETEVYMADSASELGLWYRLAPITWLGGSLLGTGCIRDPFEPAALGSAILHGPRPGDWGSAFARLSEARAARLVLSPAELAEALADLLSPDRAARLAHGAWAVASAGAEVTDHVLAMVRTRMATPA